MYLLIDSEKVSEIIFGKISEMHEKTHRYHPQGIEGVGVKLTPIGGDTVDMPYYVYII
jgi:hypothetical protein